MSNLKGLLVDKMKAFSFKKDCATDRSVAANKCEVLSLAMKAVKADIWKHNNEIGVLQKKGESLVDKDEVEAIRDLIIELPTKPDIDEFQTKVYFDLDKFNTAIDFFEEGFDK